MVRYELKKMFARPAGKVVLLLLALTLIVSCSALDMGYVNAQGETEHGPAAVRQLRTAKKAWAGVLDEEKLRRVIEENRRVNATPEAQSDDVTQREIAYSWKQGFDDIRDLLNCAFEEEFRSYDYYRADSLAPEDAGQFYARRIQLLKDWLAGEAAEAFSEPEKAFLIRQYETLETPFLYDYMTGWTQMFEYLPMLEMLTVLILSYLIAGICSNEFQWKADAVFFSSEYGRNKAVSAKIKACFLAMTAVYWAMIALFTGFALLYLGADGAFCPVQASFGNWKCFYHFTNLEAYLLTVAGGYLGGLFFAFLSMLVSAKTRSGILAVTVPFVLILLPSILSNFTGPIFSKVLGLLPDQLLQMSASLGIFSLYQFGGKVIASFPLLLALYAVLTLLLPPALYQGYRRTELR